MKKINRRISGLYKIAILTTCFYSTNPYAQSYKQDSAKKTGRILCIVNKKEFPFNNVFVNTHNIEKMETVKNKIINQKNETKDGIIYLFMKEKTVLLSLSELLNSYGITNNLNQIVCVDEDTISKSQNFIFDKDYVKRVSTVAVLVQGKPQTYINITTANWANKLKDKYQPKDTNTIWIR